MQTDIYLTYATRPIIKLNLSRVKSHRLTQIRTENTYDRFLVSLSANDGRQIENVRGADQYQLLKINVRNSYPVDLLTPGFQFDATERNVFRCAVKWADCGCPSCLDEE